MGAGFPDYPWMFATDGEYTAFASVAVGQFEAIEDHLRALRDVSDILNDRSGVVTHEVISDGSIWFGKDSRHIDPPPARSSTTSTPTRPSSSRARSRSSGDGPATTAFRDEMYDFSKRNLRYVVDQLDEDGDGWPEGSGNVERGGMGVEKLDNSVYLIRGLYDLADMARSKNDGRPTPGRANLARKLHDRFEATWWMAGGAAARRLDRRPAGRRPEQPAAGPALDRRDADGGGAHDRGGRRARPDHASITATRPWPCARPTATAASARTTSASSTPAARAARTGSGERTIFGLNTAIQAVGEGNYGRLGPGQQQRYTGAEAEPMFGEPWTGGTPDEQPGALPEILPSPDFDGAGPLDANIDRCWTCRAMFVQAWGHYGTAWPVVHQQLGVRPDMGRAPARGHAAGAARASPRVAGRTSGSRGGAVDVAASRAGGTYRTTAQGARGALALRDRPHAAARLAA